MKEETQKNIVQLQMLEQNLQNTLAQKQNFQAQASEMTNALKEVKDTKEKIFKVIGNIMISVEKNRVEKDLSEKKEILDLRIKNLEKQEKSLKEKFDSLQKEVMKNIKK